MTHWSDELEPLREVLQTLDAARKAGGLGMSAAWLEAASRRLQSWLSAHEHAQTPAVEGALARQDSNQPLRDALADVSLWLRSALNCKHWVWDSDQRLAAMGCLAMADELLQAPLQTPTGPANELYDLVREMIGALDSGSSIGPTSNFHARLTHLFEPAAAGVAHPREAVAAPEPPAVEIPRP
jgi:hypothetical protein